jgi:hypothetical protein
MSRLHLAIDPALRLEFEALSAADALWRARAAAAIFVPAVQMPVHMDAGIRAGGRVPALAVAIGTLTLVRIVLKLAGSDAWTTGLPVVSMLLLVAAVVWLVRTEVVTDSA